MPAFSLAKWYLDCVTDEGEAVIAYRAELRWGAVAIGYASVLRHREKTEVRSTLRACPLPELRGDELLWEAPPLRIEGRWRALAPAARETVSQGVDWICVQPRSEVELRLDGRTLRGLGYAEELKLTVPPWKLPIDELRWGRWVAKDRGLVWIDWRGPHSKKVSIGGEPSELALDEGRVLRSGAIGETALSIIPDLHKVFPGRIVGLHETKWLARGRIGSSEGWAIHEIVKWP